MQSVFPFFPRRFWLPPSCPSKPPSVTTQALSSDMQRWRRRGYPDSPSPDVTRQGEKEESRNDARWRRGGGVCVSPLWQIDSFSLCPPHPPLAENSTAEKQSLENPLHLFLSLSSHFSSLPLQVPPPTMYSTPLIFTLSPLLSNAEQMRCILRNVRLQTSQRYCYLNQNVRKRCLNLHI